MFDIGFSELLVIGVVALIVIGPERLPGVARTLGHLFGRMQRYVNDELKKLRQNVEDSARSIEQSVTQELNVAQQELRGLESLANPVADAAAPAARDAADAPQATPAETAPASAGQPKSA